MTQQPRPLRNSPNSDSTRLPPLCHAHQINGAGKDSWSESAAFDRSIERKLEDVTGFMDDSIDDADPRALSNIKTGANTSGTATATTKAAPCRSLIMRTTISKPHSQHRDTISVESNQPMLTAVQRSTSTYSLVWRTAHLPRWHTG